MTEKAPDSGAVSPEDAERLAERFKPSWEVDEAPFAAPEGPSAAPVAPLPAALVSPAQTVPTLPAPPSDPPVPTPAVPVAAAVPDTGRAAIKAKHARTMVGLAPPMAGGSPASPASPAAPRGASEAAPNAFAMAVPPTPLSPPVTPKGQDGLPSVVLAPSLAPPVPARLAVHSSQTLIIARPEDDLDSIEFKKPSKAPLLIALGVLIAGGIGAFIVFGRGKDTPAPTPTPVATQAPAPTPEPPPPRVVAAPVPPPPAATAPEPPPAPTKEIAAAKTPVAAEEAPPPAKTREAPQAASPPKPPPPAPKPAPAAPKPPPAKPAGQAKPSGGGIVRDVPF